MRWLSSLVAADFFFIFNVACAVKEKIFVVNYSESAELPSFIADNHDLVTNPSLSPLSTSSLKTAPPKNVIIIGNAKFGVKGKGAISNSAVDELIKYTEDGGNLLWILHEQESNAISRKLASKLGRRLVNRLGIYKDYASGINNSAFEVVPWEGLEGRAFSGNQYNVPVDSVFGHFVESQSNPLTFPLIVGKSTGMLEGGSEGEFGNKIVIASALQTRLNSRITIASIKLTEGSVNLMDDLIKWTFQKQGQLILQSFSHHHHNHLNSPRDYRINDIIDVSVCLGGDGDGRVQPNDVQVELVMLDAWIRADLRPSHDGCLHTGPLKLPSRYGVYTLKLVDYKRHGWSYISHQEKMVIRPLHHDEIVRYRFAALPYYVSWVSVMFGSLIILLLLLNPPSKDKIKEH